MMEDDDDDDNDDDDDDASYLCRFLLPTQTTESIWSFVQVMPALN